MGAETEIADMLPYHYKSLLLLCHYVAGVTYEYIVWYDQWKHLPPVPHASYVYY